MAQPTPPSNSDRPALLVIDDDQAQLELTELSLAQITPHVRVRPLLADRRFVGQLQRDEFQTDQLPAVVLLDYQLGNLDATEILPALRRAMPGVPIVLFTGTLTERRARHSEHAGADWCVAKPASLSEVREFSRQLQEHYPCLRGDGDLLIN